MMKTLSIGLFALAGCTVMVNGKPRKIGGGSDPQPVASQPAATGGQQQQQAANGEAPKPRPLPPGQIIAIDAALGRDPLVVPLATVIDTSWSKMFGNHNSPDCGSSMTSSPIASFDIKQADSQLTVALLGGSRDGFIIRKGDLYWTSCDTTMEPVKEGWQPGRYDIYPIARYSQGKQMEYTLELYRPSAPVALDTAQKLVIGGKLDKPMFVDVTLKANRRKLREAHSGRGCEKVALPVIPDIALEIERPIPGLTIRPLPTATPVTVRKEKLSDKQASIYCVENNRSGYSSSNAKAPTYSAPSEVSFGREEEGRFNLSFGTPNAEEMKITLMVFDDTTVFDPMYVRPFGGEQPTLEQRWIGYQMPQLRTGSLGNADTFAEAEHGARVFAAVPKQALVYAKLTFDKDLGGGDGFPVKNEPLVLLGIERERATVLTADGLKFYVKASHVLLAPDGATAVPTKSRAAAAKDIGGTISMLSPAQKKLGDAHYKRVEARDTCLDRAWEPYRKQLPSITRPAGVDIVVYKSARTKAIEEAGERAMDKKCGTSESFSKQTEATRAKLAVEVEKNRAKLLAEATANLK
jgi:hypothetical protein